MAGALREMEECFKEDDVSNTGFNRLIKILDSLITSIMAFVGLNRESISREQGWNSLDAGRKAEQSLLLVIMLRSALTTKKLDEQVEYNLMEAVLKSHEVFGQLQIQVAHLYCHFSQIRCYWTRIIHDH